MTARRLDWRCSEPARGSFPWGFSFDIDAGARVRDAVGDEMTLMLDPSWSYSYAAALEVGLKIEELGYLCYEDPLPALDIHGYRSRGGHRVSAIPSVLLDGRQKGCTCASKSSACIESTQ